MSAQPQGLASEPVLRLRRTFQAPRDAVFRAFTDPDQIKAWFGPRGYAVIIDRYEARPGGAYRLCMTAPDGSAHWLHGSFVTVEPPERLSFTWIWEQGDMAERETLVTIGFRSSGAATEIDLEHSRLPSEGSREAHAKGWSSSFDCLADFLAQHGR